MEAYVSALTTTGRTCCFRCCLENLFTHDCKIRFISNCLLEVDGLNRSERKEYLTEKIIQSIQPQSSFVSNYSYNWIVGRPPGRVHVVCKEAFMLCYGVGHSYIQVIFQPSFIV